ncbi:MAG: Guanosine-3',5'-bis(Diphosphate) 3'-pyrophosphohydrolase, partial [uncultured Cytophagales bacterium]
ATQSPPHCYPGAPGPAGPLRRPLPPPRDARGRTRTQRRRTHCGPAARRGRRFPHHPRRPPPGGLSRTHRAGRGLPHQAGGRTLRPVRGTHQGEQAGGCRQAQRPGRQHGRAPGAAAGSEGHRAAEQVPESVAPVGAVAV